MSFPYKIYYIYNIVCSFSGRVYTFTVEAQDRGFGDHDGQKFSTLGMAVFVRPEDGGALITPEEQSVTIIEDSAPGSHVMTVSRQNSHFYLTSTTVPGSMDQMRFFAVDRETGEVTTTRVLDRDAGYSSFIVEVYAMDISGARPTARRSEVCLIYFSYSCFFFFVI